MSVSRELEFEWDETTAEREKSVSSFEDMDEKARFLLSESIRTALMHEKGMLKSMIDDLALASEAFKNTKVSK